MAELWRCTPEGSAPPSPGAGAGAGDSSSGGASWEPGRPGGQGARGGQGAGAEPQRGPPAWGCAGTAPPVPQGSESATSSGSRLGAAPDKRASPGSAAEPGYRLGPGPGAHSCAAQRNDADLRGGALMLRLLCLLGMGPEASSRRDRAGGEPDAQLGARREWEAAGTACEIRKTAERLQMQLEALKGSSNPETLEFLQALEAPLRIASRVLAENQRLRRELEETKGRLAAPASQHPSIQLPTRWPLLSRTPQTPFPRATQQTALPLQVRVSGKTAGCERQFVDQLAHLLAAQGISLQAGEYEPHSSHPLLLFCPISTRAGTDISNALEGIPATRKAVLVVLHHQPNEQAELYASSKGQAQHPGLLDTVDSCFSTQSGFYRCQANATAVASVAAALGRLALGRH
ncbi:uncharacterized protein LOC142010750 [Carettochelys insculpta]|uniref:uncharacterized protein LOC142010750 n=1 Tax=Carettochelys insculpta TaxID=44489 RepID=UPI003EBB69F0